MSFVKHNVTSGIKGCRFIVFGTASRVRFHAGRLCRCEVGAAERVIQRRLDHDQRMIGDDDFGASRLADGFLDETFFIVGTG